MTSSLFPTRHAATTQRQLVTFRAQLIEQRGFREEQLRALCRTPVRPTRSAREITATLKSGARSALREVEAALRRMDEGSFGLCVSCGEPVPLARLEVLPHVARCLPCQRAADLA